MTYKLATWFIIFNLKGILLYYLYKLQVFYYQNFI
jgi:hypothetical protein